MTDARFPGLLEREVESTAIQDAVKAASQGHSGLLLVEGPAGIGKTRLLRVARAAADELGLNVARAVGSELERDFAFGVVRQLFEPLLARTEHSEQDALWEGPASQAQEIFTTTTGLTAGDFAVLHGLYWLTANTSHNRPLVVVVDDLQWCDIPSLRYLVYLLPRIEDLSLLIVIALRTGETPTDALLLQQITANPVVQVLRPRPLSALATALLLDRALPGRVEQDFAAACHEAAGGNPLLLCELARTIVADGLETSTASATRVADLGPRAVDQLVAARLARLPQECIALARAVAVLGGHTDLTLAAALGGHDLTTALEAAAGLERAGILHVRYHDGLLTLSFVHPLIRTAVYGSENLADRATAHLRAARLLADAGATPERIAAHLLRVTPTGDGDTVAMLRAAAAQASRRGSPQAAVTYLERALHEPPSDTELSATLLEAGQIAEAVDNDAAVRYLRQALALTADPLSRAEIARLLGQLFLLLGQFEKAAAVWSEALAELPPGQEDLARRLHAGLINLGVLAPGLAHLRAKASQLRDLPFHDSLGGRELVGLIACWEACRGEPMAIGHAHAALSDDILITQAPGGSALPGAYFALVPADDAAVIQSIETAIAQAYRRGAVRDLVPALAYRALARLRRGDLAAAEADARECETAIDSSAMAVARPFLGPFLAHILLEQGRTAEAEAALTWMGLPDPLPPNGPLFFYLEAQARLLRTQGHLRHALHTALAAGDRFAALDGSNPAICGWRTEAAQCLHILDRADEARALAAEELTFARRWGAPWALGRALRVNGLVAAKDDGLEFLREAVKVLENSSARLEHAKALAHLGAALRRAGHRRDASPHLRQALDLATRCGASPLAEFARDELKAAGGRPRRPELTGPGSLTFSESRIAELAAGGATNRQIAQDLYVTVKTVEVHLSAVYRKLGITSRAQLPAALRSPRPANAPSRSVGAR
ncbi:ATP-binding protein [Streptomyces sp. NPDC048419]|uniref:ATP-binding protein n=1 Tax=Streptomyces sp. NPDC048419 TaxID=3365547 RepID=UPI003715B535